MKKTWQKMLKNFLSFMTNQMMSSVGKTKNASTKVSTIKQPMARVPGTYLGLP